tara:strand:+ start:1250 stop:1435 length:186 start_codon:yes stop_codon:yes gene_type:complete
MKKGAEDFKKRWANKDKEPRKDSAPLIEEIDTTSMEEVSKSTQSKSKKKDLMKQGKDMISE